MTGRPVVRWLRFLAGFAVLYGTLDGFAEIDGSGHAVGRAATVVAAATAVPFAHLCLWEMGRRTIWAPAPLHTTIDTFKLVVLPPGATVTFSLVLAAVSATVPFLVLAVPRTRPLAETRTESR